VVIRRTTRTAQRPSGDNTISTTVTGFNAGCYYEALKQSKAKQSRRVLSINSAFVLSANKQN